VSCVEKLSSLQCFHLVSCLYYVLFVKFIILYVTGLFNLVTNGMENGVFVIFFYWTVKDTAVPAEGNGDLQTLICVLVARPRRCLTLSNPVPWQNWMAAYLGYTRRMKTLFHCWPIMVNDTHTRRRWICVPVSGQILLSQSIRNGPFQTLRDVMLNA